MIDYRNGANSCEFGQRQSIYLSSDSIHTTVNLLGSRSTCTYRRAALITSGADQSGMARGRLHQRREWDTHPAHVETVWQTLLGTFNAHQSPVIAPPTERQSTSELCTLHFWSCRNHCGSVSSIIACVLLLHSITMTQTGKWINITSRRQRGHLAAGQ